MLGLYRMFLLQWTARVGSLICLIVAAVWLIGGGFTPAQVDPWLGFGLLVFSVGVLFGELLAWRWEKLGSLLSMVSLAGFCLTDLIWVSGAGVAVLAAVAFSVPAFLFLSNWLFGRHHSAQLQRLLFRHGR